MVPGICRTLHSTEFTVEFFYTWPALLPQVCSYLECLLGVHHCLRPAVRPDSRIGHNGISCPRGAELFVLSERAGVHVCSTCSGTVNSWDAEVLHLLSAYADDSNMPNKWCVHDCDYRIWLIKRRHLMFHYQELVTSCCFPTLTYQMRMTNKYSVTDPHL